MKLIAMTLWCQYLYEVIWYEGLSPQEWAQAVRGLCQ